MNNNMILSDQLEDYLESIERLSREKGDAHVLDIAERLSVHKSTVTAALRSLAKKGLIHYQAYKPATMTRSGKKIAEEVVRRHEALQSFLKDVLLLDPETAERNACKLEHSIEKKALDRLMNYADFVQTCPRGGTKWIRGFEYFCHEGQPKENCENCIESCLENYRARKGEQNDLTHNQEENKVMSLKDIKPGSSANVRRITHAGKNRRRLIDMGLVPGTHVEVVKVAPLGDPIEIKAKGYNLSLRKEEAAAIEVKKV